MDTNQFIAAYNDRQRNGTESFHFNPLYRQMQYSDGVQECAKAGCYWLLDIIGTECLKPLRASGDHFGVVDVKVLGNKADLSLTVTDPAGAEVKAWSRHLGFADMPDGLWVFYLSDEGDRFALILPSEY